MANMLRMLFGMSEEAAARKVASSRLSHLASGVPTPNAVHAAPSRSPAQRLRDLSRGVGTPDARPRKIEEYHLNYWRQPDPPDRYHSIYNLGRENQSWPITQSGAPTRTRAELEAHNEFVRARKAKQDASIARSPKYGPKAPNDELRRAALRQGGGSPGAMALPGSPAANRPISVASPPGTTGGRFPLHNVAGGMVLGGIAGYTTGDQDAWSFGKGAVIGGIGGLALTAGRGSVVSGAESLAERYAAKSSDPNVAAAWRARGAKAREFGEMLDTKEGRVATFAAGSMLAGGGFNAIFNGGNRRNHKRGFNQNRGNTF